MNSLREDIRQSLRNMGKNPGFALSMFLTLALSLTVSTAIFGTVNTVLFHTVPFRDSSQLVKIMFNKPGVGLHDITFSYPEFDDLRKKTNLFQGVTVVWPASGNLTGGNEPVRLELLACNPNYFSLLGVKPQIGRLFGPEDNAYGFAETAVISDSLWRRSFGGDQSAIGKILKIDNDPYKIVGVLPPDFRHPGRTVAGEVDVWLTAGFSGDPFKVARSNREFPGLMARLKPGVSLAQAQRELDQLATDTKKQNPNDYPANANWSIQVQPLREALIGEVGSTLWLLLGAALLVLMLASFNTSNLFLARAAKAETNAGLRILSKAPCACQIFIESVILSLAAGVVGIVIATEAWRIVAKFVPTRVFRLADVSLGVAVILFAFLAALVIGVFSAIGPAKQLSRSTKSHPSVVRNTLVGLETIIALGLIVWTGVLSRRLLSLLHEDPGFQSSHLVAARIWLPIPNNPKTDKYEGLGPQSRVERALLSQVQTVPGVESVALTSALPVLGGRQVKMQLAVEGRPAVPSSDLRAEVIRVSPSFFQVMQTPLLEGRSITETDEKDQPEVAVIDESTARRFWPGQSAIGMHVRNVADSTTHPVVITVVGVTKNIKHDGLDKAGTPHLYTSFYQRSGRALALVVRTAMSPTDIKPKLEQAVHTVDPDLPLFGLSTMDDFLVGSLAQQRFSAGLAATFGVLALFLAATGIYSTFTLRTRWRAQAVSMCCSSCSVGVERAG